MDCKKASTLIENGWKIGSYQEFLNLNEKERIMDYQKLALKTESPIDSRLRDRLHERDSIRLLHGILIIAGEVEELQKAVSDRDIVNIKEEIGDMCWGANLVLNVLEQEFPTISTKMFQYELPFEINVIVNTASKLCDLIKRQIYYGAAANRDDLACGASNIIVACASIAKHFGFDIEDAKKRNIAKLEKRYPNKFSEENAVNRDLQREREVLSA